MTRWLLISGFVIVAGLGLGACSSSFGGLTAQANLAGDNDNSSGKVLFEVIVNVAGADVPPKDVTVNSAEPVDAIKLAGTSAVSCVALT